jgi:hypothetical protein
VLPLPKESPRELLIQARALIDASKSSQRVKVFVNGRPIQTLSLSKEQGNQIYIPLSKEDLKADRLELVFEFLDARSPKSAGLGDDERLLAIGIESAKFQ